jgi:hypothetical protein
MGKFREKEFSIQQKKALKTLYSRQPKVTQASPESILLKYVGFESITRKVWNYSRKIKKKDASDSYGPIPIHSLNGALKNFGVQLNEVVIERLLSSDLTKRNNKSARNLRNAIVHQWREADFNEISERYANLSNDIDKFMDAVKAGL